MTLPGIHGKGLSLIVVMGKTFKYDWDDHWEVPDRRVHSPKSKLVRGEGRMDRILARREKYELKQSSLSEDKL